MIWVCVQEATKSVCMCATLVCYKGGNMWRPANPQPKSGGKYSSVTRITRDRLMTLWELHAVVWQQRIKQGVFRQQLGSSKHCFLEKKAWKKQTQVIHNTIYCLAYFTVFREIAYRDRLPRVWPIRPYKKLWIHFVSCTVFIRRDKQRQILMVVCNFQDMITFSCLSLLSWRYAVYTTVQIPE